jgi:hypothetical protein
MNSMWAPLLRPEQPKPQQRPGRRPPTHPTKYSVGDQVGEWTLLDYQPGGHKPVRKVPRWLCRCSCGVTRWVLGSNLLSGQSKSCGHAKRQGYRAVTLNGGDIRNPTPTMIAAKKGT